MGTTYTLSDGRTPESSRTPGSPAAPGDGAHPSASKTLADLAPDETVTVTAVGGTGALRHHVLDMGITPGVRVTFIKPAPMGDPLQFRVRGYILTLRASDARMISVVDVPLDEESPKQQRMPEPPSHPGIGESGIHHVRAGHPSQPMIPEGEILTLALAGNQNCGKTTLFNQLTGSNQHVGNFPGVTVDRKDGMIRRRAGTNVTDLPGIYSLSPYSPEELVSRRFILDERPSGIIDIVDATSIDRNLYLTTQLLELGIPMVLALNMMDEMQGNGGYVRANLMESLLGIPVVPISAIRNEGVDELVDHAVHVARYREFSGTQEFFGGDGTEPLQRCLRAVAELVSSHAQRTGIPLRFAATKIVEGDATVIDALGLTERERDTMEQIVAQMEEECGLDRSAAIADMRFSFIEKVVSACVVRPTKCREQLRSERVDRMLTDRWAAIPTFIAIMTAIFVLTFNVIGPFLQDIMQQGIDRLSGEAGAAMGAAGVNPAVHSLVIDGIFGGIGAVILFLPLIVTLFFFLSLLEDTGYMARIAFISDRLLRRIGLSGRAVVPMLIAIGCTVPAVMAARTLPSERDRKLTVMLTPFMGCSPKLAIYSFLADAFFPGHAGWVVAAIYLLGIAMGILTALVSRRVSFRGEAVPFMMELPTYRMPSAKSVLMLVWDKSRDFVRRAFTVIFVATVATWFLQAFDPRLIVVEDASRSMLALLSGWLAPLLAPLGLGDWRIVSTLITGFIAKETIVSSLSVLYGGMAGLVSILSPLTALCLMVFVLLYAPCIAAIDAVRREMGWKWAVWIAFYQCALAWAVAFAVRLCGRALGMG